MDSIISERGFRAAIRRLGTFPGVLRAAAMALTDDELRWKPASADWSVLEVLWHLADEERLDFPVRFRLIVERPLEDWPPIDPEGWARERRYNELDAGEALDTFQRARGEHVGTLSSLDVSCLAREHTHARFGSMSAGQMLASWCAHDALHLRQIAKRCYGLVGRDFPGVSTDYAGAW